MQKYFVTSASIAYEGIDVDIYSRISQEYINKLLGNLICSEGTFVETIEWIVYYSPIWLKPPLIYIDWYLFLS